MSEFTLIRDPRDEETSDYIYDVCQSCGAEIIINIFDDSPSLCVDCTFSPVSNVPNTGAGETPNDTPKQNLLSNGVPVSRIRDI